MTIPVGDNNHIELVHRPGERDLAIKLLTLLGCEPILSPFAYKGVQFIFSKSERIWISEVCSEQWAFEQWLQCKIAEDNAPEVSAFMSRLGQLPQAHAHFGIGLPSLYAWEAATTKIRHALDNDPDFMGRATMPIYHRPEFPDSVAGQTAGKIGKTLFQAFIRTDIFASGLLTLGQSIELQVYLENDPGYDGDVTLIQESISS